MEKLSLVTGSPSFLLDNRPVPVQSAPTYPYASAEQVAYAGVLQVGMRLSLALMASAFLAYMLGLLPLSVPASDMPQYWGMSAQAYLETRHIPHHGWPWLHQMLEGDFIFAGIALMAAVTVGCYAYFVRFPLKSGDRVMTVVVIAEIAVLALAASGLLAVGH